MVELSSYILLIGILVLGILLLQRRDPTRLNRIWQIISMAVVGGSFWVWYERADSFGDTFELQGVSTIVIIAVAAFIMFGIFKSQPFSKKYAE